MTMGPKNNNDSKVKRKMTRITTEVKKENIAKHENGICVSDLATQFGMAKSTICTSVTQPFRHRSTLDLSIHISRYPLRKTPIFLH
jgi:transposase-like protein